MKYYYLSPSKSKHMGMEKYPCLYRQECIKKLPLCCLGSHQLTLLECKLLGLYLVSHCSAPSSMKPLKVLMHPPYLITLHPSMQQSGIVMGTPLPPPGGAYILEKYKVSETGCPVQPNRSKPVFRQLERECWFKSTSLQIN